MKYRNNLPFYSTEKHKMLKMVHFEMNLYFMKLNFYFNLYAVITTCKLQLHDSGSIENHNFFINWRSRLSHDSETKKIRKLNKIT